MTISKRDRCPVRCELGDAKDDKSRGLDHRCLGSHVGHDGPCEFPAPCGRNKGALPGQRAPTDADLLKRVWAEATL